MNTFSCIFFHVYTRDVNALFYTVFSLYVYRSSCTDGRGILRDLVSFGKIRIKIILAGILVYLANIGIYRKPQFYGIFHHLFIGNRQGVPGWPMRVTGLTLVLGKAP